MLKNNRKKKVMISGKSVSLCMVIFNQSELLKRAIDSVSSIIDELVLVDQGSDEKLLTDELTSLVKVPINYIRTTNKGNADYDRSYCYALATKDYVLAMDADEVIPKETIDELARCITVYDFDVCWFLFKNSIYHEDKEVDLERMLGSDPHPRFWKRVIKFEDRDLPPLQWPTEAHKFPDIITQKQLFLFQKFEHKRDLESVIRTHLKRGKNISPEAQQVEKNFIRGVLNEFGSPATRGLIEKFPEIPYYLR